MKISAKEINTRSEELIQEFLNHWNEVIELNLNDPAVTKSSTCEGWLIQKVASLQLLIEELYRGQQNQ